jgi:hypothetical protein
MAILAETNTGWNTGSTFGGADSPIYNSTTVTATSAGTATGVTMVLHANVWDSAGSTFKICIYRQSDNSRVGVATFTTADAAGTTVTRTFDGAATFAVSLSEQFYGLQVNDGTLTLNADSTGFLTLTAATGSYASPPASIAPGSDATNVRAQFRFAIDGTAGGGGGSTVVVVPSAGAQRNRRHSGRY